MQRKWLFAIPIILVMLLLCAAMAAILVVSAGRLSLNGVPFLALGQVRANAETEEQKSFELSLPGSLVVNDPCGDVSISADAQGQQVSVTAHKRAWGRNTEQAQENLAKIELSMTQEGDTVRLGLAENMQNCQLALNVPFNVDYTVHVPQEMAVQVDTGAGNISLVGTQGKAQLTSQFGDVTVRQLSGQLTATSDNGKITAQDIQAGAQPIRLTTAFGDVHLTTAEADALHAESNNGGIELTGVVISGTVELSSDFGDVSWKDGRGQSLTAGSKNGKLSLQDLAFDQALVLTNDFGDIVLRQVQAASYSATTTNGTISLEGVAGEVTARSDFGDIAVTGDGHLKLNLTSQNGTIEASGSLADAQQTLQTEFGDVRLRLPEDAAFNFDLKTSFGKISSVFPVTIEGTPKETHWQGTVNGGGPNLKAVTENGNIVIEYNQ